MLRRNIRLNLFGIFSIQTISLESIIVFELKECIIYYNQNQAQQIH